MTKNVGGIDRWIRAILGIGLIYLTLFSGLLVTDPIAMVLLGLMGIILVLTAIFANCPAYILIGLNTRCKAPNKP